jgi:hypothetical protein
MGSAAVDVSRRGSYGAELGVGACVAALAVMLLGFLPFPPLQDFPEWIYQAHVIGQLMAGGKSPYFYLHPYPVPYCASQLVMAVLDRACGLVLGPKVFVALYLAAGFALSLQLTRRHRLHAPVAMPALFCFVVCNSTFFSGYLNYQVGLLVLMAYLCLDEERRMAMPTLTLFALLAFASHGMAFVSLGVIAGAKAAVTRRIPAFIASMAPAGVLAIWYTAAQTGAPALPEVVHYGSLRFFAYKLYTLAKAGPYHDFWIGSAGDFQRGARPWYIGGAAINLACAGVIALGLGVMLATPAPDRERRSLRLAASILLAAFLLSPDVALGVVNPGERFLYPLILCWLLQCREPAARWTTPAGAPLLAAIPLVLVVGLAGVIKATAGEDPTLLRSQEDVSAAGQARALFVVRPFQFVERYDTWTNEVRQGIDLDVPLTFRTSMLGDRRPAPEPDARPRL